ncbi:unnamed protein product, partial [Discosporangium mesarthrocarpum]
HQQCVVIGLQGTGEASTGAALRQDARGDGGGGTASDFISAPHQTVKRVIKRCFPLPPRPRDVR